MTTDIQECHAHDYDRRRALASQGYTLARTYYDPSRSYDARICVYERKVPTSAKPEGVCAGTIEWCLHNGSACCLFGDSPTRMTAREAVEMATKLREAK